MFLSFSTKVIPDMKIHEGLIVQKAIRESKISVSEVARLINVDRRTVYNWFTHQTLKLDTIEKISQAINYDFSHEIPKLAFVAGQVPRKQNLKDSDQDQHFWMDKYIELLEKYNALLLDATKECREPVEA